VSAGNFVETALIFNASRDPAASRRSLVKESQITIEPVTERRLELRERHPDFGKATGHRARLNFGDCFAYALAKVTGNLCCSKPTILVAPIKPPSN
jgi:ribonuclease VapC